jgi:hypothetical protein
MLPGVSAVLSDGERRWRVPDRVDGRLDVGSFRIMQGDAYAGRKRMEGSRAALPKKILMFGDAFDAVTVANRARELR